MQFYLSCGLVAGVPAVGDNFLLLCMRGSAAAAAAAPCAAAAVCAAAACAAAALAAA